MRSVFDYKDIRKLDELSINNAIKNGIIITATSELNNAMRDYYSDYKVFDIHRCINEIIKEWEENVKDIKNYVILRNVIENYINDNGIREEVSSYLRRNASDMWNAIKLLIEADVYPEDVNSSISEPVKHFSNIWKQLEIDNPQIMRFRTTFSYELSNREAVINKLKSIVGEIKGDIYLVGFYFITPIQDRIFDILEDAGFHLCFLNCHDYRYEYATQIWEKTFSQYEDKSVRDLQNNLIVDNYFGCNLTGERKEIPLKILKHYTEFEFAEMVKTAVDKGEVVYSPDAKMCENILKEYYPEYYDQKHLLSYPVGQYVYYLHMMWDSFSNKMDMKFEYVYKCFSSGWLIKEKLNGKDFLYKIKILEPYFKFCHSIEDWEERLKTLNESKKITSAFNERENGKKRWHVLQGNPLVNMAIYNLEETDIENINKLINKLIDDATFLFKENDKIDLFEHFKKISNIIRQNMDKENLIEDEILIAKELLAQLDDESAKGIECPLNGIRDAIVLLIGNHFGEYETYEEETSNHKRMVLPLSMVEAAMLNNYGQKIHLVLANEFVLPGQPKSLPWPLTDDVIHSLDISGREKTKKYVNDMRSVIDNRPLSYRYLFFSFMGVSNQENTAELSVEWICKNENKEIDISAYIKLLNLENDVLFEYENEDADYDFLEIERNITSENYILEKPKKSLPDEVIMDYLLCPERYVYSYLVNYLPSYSSEYHYSFELSKLISAFSIVSGIDKEEVSKNVSELFPFLRNVEIRQSADFAKSQGKLSPNLYENVEYPAQRFITHFINDEIILIANKRIDDFIETGIYEEKIIAEMCVYCPYSDICLIRHKDEVDSYE